MQLLPSSPALVSSLCSDLFALSSKLVSNSISGAALNSEGRNTFVCDSRIVCPSHIVLWTICLLFSVCYSV